MKIANKNLLGVGSLVLGILIFSLQDITVKWMGGSYPILEIVLFRSMIALPATLVFDYPTIAALAEYLTKDVLQGEEAVETASGSQQKEEALDDLLDRIEGLSDEEADRMYSREKSQSA